MTAESPTERCAACAHFVDDPRELERQLTGLTILSSAWGDTRGDQGLCALHGQFLQPVMHCPGFVGRARDCGGG